MTSTRSKVKVKVTGLLNNFRQLAKPCMLAAMTAAPLRGFLVFGHAHLHSRTDSQELRVEYCIVGITHNTAIYLFLIRARRIVFHLVVALFVQQLMKMNLTCIFRTTRH